MFQRNINNLSFKYLNPHHCTGVTKVHRGLLREGYARVKILTCIHGLAGLYIQNWALSDSGGFPANES